MLKSKVHTIQGEYGVLRDFSGSIFLDAMFEEFVDEVHFGLRLGCVESHCFLNFGPGFERRLDDEHSAADAEIVFPIRDGGSDVF
mgnify:CR=1 FL=1|tara:strand:- start:604 stop:858 length:255 start_codon:yes stop_codon:yes gene_type:complete